MRRAVLGSVRTDSGHRRVLERSAGEDEAGSPARTSSPGLRGSGGTPKPRPGKSPGQSGAQILDRAQDRVLEPLSEREVRGDRRGKRASRAVGRPRPDPRRHELGEEAAVEEKVPHLAAPAVPALDEDGPGAEVGDRAGGHAPIGAVATAKPESAAASGRFGVTRSQSGRRSRFEARGRGALRGDALRSSRP